MTRDNGNGVGPGKPPKSGRPPADIELTAPQIDALATALARRGLTRQQVAMLDHLASGGVMTAQQIQAVTGLAYKTLANYQADLILDRVRYPDLAAELEKVGLGDRRARAAVYTLGVVGMRLAERLRLPHKPAPNAYMGLNASRIVHDLCVNEIILRLKAKAVEKGWEPEWIDRSRAVVYDERGVPALEPDALILLKRPDHERLLALEFHNEDHGNRSMLKLSKYQNAYTGGRWKYAWETETFPTVLAVFRHEFVGANYVDSVARLNGFKLRFVGKSWAEFLAEPAEAWVEFKTMKYLALLREPQPAPEGAKP